jgi:phosphate uptake regulator
MTFWEGIKENFSFLVLEVAKQVEDTRHVLREPSPKLIERIHSRDNYVDTIRTIITNKTFNALCATADVDRESARIVQAIGTIANNLESIGDFCTNIVGQLRYLSDISFFHEFVYEDSFDVIESALAKVETTVFTHDVDLALKICRAESLLDAHYKRNFDLIMARLQNGEPPADLITCMFIMRYLERIGDSLENIGEAVISSALGEKLKMRHYLAFEDSYDVIGAEVPGAQSAHADPNDEIVFESIAETRSGGRIGRVRRRNDRQKPRWVIFKEGSPDKVTQEKENIELWEGLFPGLPPKIFRFSRTSNHATLLLEYIDGATFQEVILDHDLARLQEAQDAIHALLGKIWTSTKQKTATNAAYVDQLRARLSDVFYIHPEFDEPGFSIGELHVPSFQQSLKRLAEIGRDIDAPFSVFIHGDFNTDNIMYSFRASRLHLIDLNRSQQTDFVQDVAVFLVSNFRIPVFEENLRRRLNFVSLRFFDFARRFALENGDTTFEARLALGLVRSFITSTRFVVSDRFAREMFVRAKYIMDKTIAHAGKPWSEFKLPPDILTY